MVSWERGQTYPAILIEVYKAYFNIGPQYYMCHFYEIQLCLFDKKLEDVSAAQMF